MRQDALETTLDFLRHHAPFDQMDPAHLEFLGKRLSLNFFPKGEVIVGPDDGPANRFFIIRQGRLQGEQEQADGSRESRWELIAGECFPIGALLAQRPVRLVNRAIEDSFVFELARDDFNALRRQSPVFQDFCARRMANLLDQALRGIQARSAADVSEHQSLHTPLHQLLKRGVVSCAPDTPLQKALQTMHDERVGSMVVIDEAHRPVGLITLHDLISRVVLPRLSLDEPIATVMTPDVVSLSAEQPASEAALLMTRHGFRHLCLIDDGGRLIGVISERDLFSLQRVGLVNLSQSINRAENIDTLVRLEPDVHRLVDQMIAQGASVDQITQIITELNDLITQRVIELVLARHDTAALPAFTWLAFGSEGRQEQTLKTDQDNGILFECPAGQEPEALRQQLLPIAQAINEALARCGFPLCEGNIMAGNPECCLSLEEWRRRFRRWLDQGSPEDVLKATIFFDFRPLYGESEPAAQLRSWLAEQAAPNSRFRRLMAENALNLRPPLGLFRDFVVSAKGAYAHALDLKVQGITPFVDGARLLSLAHRVEATGTTERLREVARLGFLNQHDVDAWCEAYHYIQLIRMRSHHRQAEQGMELSNYFDPDNLNDLDRRILKEAFRQARKLQSRIALEYQL